MMSTSAPRQGLARSVGAFAIVCALSSCASAPDPGPPPEIPQGDFSGMEPLVVRVLTETREAVVGDPLSAEAWGRLGAAHHAHGLVAIAERCYRRAAELAPEEFRWAYFLAIVRIERGAGPEEATELFEDAARLRPDYVQVHVRLGQSLLAHGRYAAAERAFSRGIEHDPGFAPAHRGLGQSRLALDRPEQAVEALERAAALDDRDGAIYAVLARAYAQLERPGPARAAAARAKELRAAASLDDPVLARHVHSMGASARHWFARARERLGRGDFAGAIRDLETVQHVRPSDADVFYLLARAHEGLESRGAAKEELVRALESNPEHVPALVALARILTDEGQPEQALGYLREAIAAAPDNPRVAFNLGTLLARQGELAGAERQFRRALALNPEYADARARLTVVLERMSGLPRAGSATDE